MTKNNRKMTDKEFNEIGKACAESNRTHPYNVGQAYLIRLVTHYWVGQLMAVYEHEMVLRNASWVADTGRFHTAVETGKMSEIEFVGNKNDVIVGRGALIDAVVWNHKLPKESK